MTITYWHRLLGQLFEDLLTSVQITVQTDFNIMSDPPRVDIVLLRRQDPVWTPAQRARLPDGIRDSTAAHVLLEFKYTESLTRQAIHKIVGYIAFYRETQRLVSTPEAAQIFILSAKTPRRAFLQMYGYHVSALPGVYYSDNCIVRDVPLLALNQLRNLPHNAYVKCFASRRREKAAAFALLEDLDIVQLSQRLGSFVMGLRTFWFKEGVDMVRIESVTPEYIRELGEQMGRFYLSTLTVDDVLPYFKPEEVLARFKPEEVLARFKPEERLAGLEPYLAELAQIQQRQFEYHALDRALRLRFQASVDAYVQRLDKLDMDDLNDLNELLLTVDNLTEFEAALENIMPAQ